MICKTLEVKSGSMDKLRDGKLQHMIYEHYYVHLCLCKLHFLCNKSGLLFGSQML